MSKNLGKVLLVEDEPLLRVSTKMLLEGCGVEVVACESVPAALELVNPSFKLVLSDVKLGGKTGIDLAEQLKANPELQHIPIVLHSTNQLSTVPATVAEFILKPLTSSHCKKLIQDYCVNQPSPKIILCYAINPWMVAQFKWYFQLLFPEAIIRVFYCQQQYVPVAGTTKEYSALNSSEATLFNDKQLGLFAKSLALSPYLVAVQTYSYSFSSEAERCYHQLFEILQNHAQGAVLNMLPLINYSMLSIEGAVDA